MQSEQGLDKSRFLRNLALIALSALLIFPCSPLPFDANAKPSDTVAKFHPVKRDPDTAQRIRTLLETEESTLLLYGKTVKINVLREMYGARNHEPLWVKRNVISPQGVALLSEIANARKHGLAPEDYEITAIHQAGKDGDNESAAKLDILISNSVRRFLTDMLFGISVEDRLETLYLGRSLTEIAESGDLHTFISELKPALPEYSSLVDVMERYQSLASNGGWPAFSPGKNIESGKQDPRIPTLRQMLSITGDLQTNGKTLPWNNAENTDKNTTPEYDATLFDSELQEAVKRFQTRHGLEADGALGKDTQAALAVPVEDRIDQIMASLERIRRMPRNLGDRYVLVNIPGYYLKAVEEGEVALESKVIVGRPSRRTPLMDNVIHQISFNPSWGVPERIARHDLLPKIQNDPEFLSKGGFTLYDTEEGENVAVDPTTIDWESVDQSNFSFRLRQHPGRGNALGKIKFGIPDSDGIYLHSTSEPNLFSKAKRALSSGCVRVEKTRELAHFILGSEENWDEDKINATYDSSASRIISVEPVKLHIMYLTSWTDETGAIHFGQDVYNKDSALIASLKRNRNGNATEYASK